MFLLCLGGRVQSGYGRALHINTGSAIHERRQLSGTIPFRRVRGLARSGGRPKTNRLCPEFVTNPMPGFDLLAQTLRGDLRFWELAKVTVVRHQRKVRL